MEYAKFNKVSWGFNFPKNHGNHNYWVSFAKLINNQRHAVLKKHKGDFYMHWDQPRLCLQTL